MTFPNEPQARVAPRSTEDLDPAHLAILSRIPGQGLKGEGFPRNVLGELMHNPKTLGPFLDYWVSAKTDLGFSVREQELVILRMGVLYQSDYVWKHHVKVAREFGVTEAEMAALRTGGYAGLASVREQALLRLTDAFVEQRCLPAKLWEETRGLLSPSDFVDLIGLVSQYVLFALTNVCLQVQLEPAVAGLPGIED